MATPLTSLDLIPFPARAAGDVIRAYQPVEPAYIQLSSGRLHRIDVVQVFADRSIIVETARQRLDGGGDFLRGGRPRWALRTLERYMAARDAQILRDAITAAELNRTMREQMATDPEQGGPRDPERPPAQRQPELGVTDPGAYATREDGRITFTLTQHGLAQLAEGLGTTPEAFAETARRSGWLVEES
jgi:hypothetical protein